MKKMTRILSLVLAVVLCVGVGVGATLAYLQSETKAVKNTFYAEGLTDVFDLKEHDVNYDTTTGLYTQKDQIPENEVTGVEYKVTPANDLPKDPFIRINPNEKAWVFVEVNSNLPETMTFEVNGELWQKITNKNTDIKGEIWARKLVCEKDVETLEYILKADEKGNTIHVAGTFEPGTVNPETALTFNGYAVQYINFEAGPQAAWDATYGQAPAAK